MATPTQGAKLFAEFLGTFLLVLTVGCNVLSGNALWGGVSIGCVLMVAIYSLGGISGANFNPAVSFALYLAKVDGHADAKSFATYSLVQIAAGILAAFSYVFLFGEAFNLAPTPGFPVFSAYLCEVFYTFLLCFVVLNVAAAKKFQEKGNQYYGLAIGLVIVAGAYGAGAVSGGAFNPAVAIGIDVSSWHLGFGFCLDYIVFQFVGAALAAGLFRLVRPEDYGGERHPVFTPLVGEFLGTFMLVLTVGLNVLGKSKAGAFSIAASLTCMIYALGDVSGAHFNPAVTIACLAAGRDVQLTPTKAGSYIVVQLFAGLLAGFTYSLIYNGGSFELGPSGDIRWSQVFVAEAAFTFVLCYVVLCVAVSRTTGSTMMFGLAIGACVTAGGNAIGGISGGSLNPAVSFGVQGSHMQHLFKAAAYSLFEVVGALLAAGVFKVTHQVDLVDDPPKEDQEDGVHADHFAQVDFETHGQSEYDGQVDLGRKSAYYDGQANLGRQSAYDGQAAHEEGLWQRLQSDQRVPASDGR